MVSAGHVLARSPVHARVGLTLVVIDVTVEAAPARVAGTFVASMQTKRQVSGVSYNRFLSFCISLLIPLKFPLNLCSPVDEVLAPAVDAGVAAALIDLRQTSGVVVALWAQAGKSVITINARAPVVTGVVGAIVDVDVTHCS